MNYIETIIEAFEEANIDLSQISEDTLSMYCPCDTPPVIQVLLHFKDIKLNSFMLLARVSPMDESNPNALSLCNELNREYSKTKFYIEDNYIFCQLDTCFDRVKCAQESLLTLLGFIHVIKDCYPRIAKLSLDYD